MCGDSTHRIGLFEQTHNAAHTRTQRAYSLLFMRTYRHTANRSVSSNACINALRDSTRHTTHTYTCQCARHHRGSVCVAGRADNRLD
jgi:hypothetical protein